MENKGIVEIDKCLMSVKKRLHSHASEIEIVDILRRKHNYREVG